MTDMDIIILLLIICTFLLIGILTGLVIMCDRLDDIKYDLHAQKLYVIDIEDCLHQKDKREFVDSLFKEKGEK